MTDNRRRVDSRCARLAYCRSRFCFPGSRWPIADAAANPKGSVHMDWIIESLRQHPEIALFFVLALGYGLGNLRLGAFKVGPVLGVLIAGIVVGQLNIPTSESLKN